MSIPHTVPMVTLHFIQCKTKALTMAWKVQHDLALYCFDFTSYHFPSHSLCFSNSVLAIPQTCLTCFCLRAFVHILLFT